MQLPLNIQLNQKSQSMTYISIAFIDLFDAKFLNWMQHSIETVMFGGMQCSKLYETKNSKSYIEIVCIISYWICYFIPMIGAQFSASSVACCINGLYKYLVYCSCIKLHIWYPVNCIYSPVSIHPLVYTKFKFHFMALSCEIP